MFNCKISQNIATKNFKSCADLIINNSIANEIDLTRDWSKALLPLICNIRPV